METFSWTFEIEFKLKSIFHWYSLKTPKVNSSVKFLFSTFKTERSVLLKVSKETSKPYQRYGYKVRLLELSQGYYRILLS